MGGQLQVGRLNGKMPELIEQFKWWCVEIWCRQTVWFVEENSGSKSTRSGFVLQEEIVLQEEKKKKMMSGFLLGWIRHGRRAGLTHNSSRSRTKLRGCFPEWVVRMYVVDQLG